MVMQKEQIDLEYQNCEYVIKFECEAQFGSVVNIVCTYCSELYVPSQEVRDDLEFWRLPEEVKKQTLENLKENLESRGLDVPDEVLYEAQF